MRIAGLAALAFALCGCTTTRYAPTACVSAEQYQALTNAEPEKVGPKLTGNAEQDVKTVGASAVRLRAWGRGLLGVIEGCQQPQPPPPTAQPL